MRIIFLNIDGVINNLNFIGTNPRFKGNLHEIYPQHIEIINKIVAATGAKIVISSSWRKRYSLYELREMFHIQGLKSEIIGTTPVINVENVRRADEISIWLSNNKTESFVIIDDIDDFLEFKDNFVKTSIKDGLLPEQADIIINMLNN